MKIGITGHQRLPQLSDWDWVNIEMHRVLEALDPPLIGISSLAAGADQLFAEVVLERGGRLEVVIPFEGYENTFTQPEDRETYLSLLASASDVEVLDKFGSEEEAYLTAGERLVDGSDSLLAVWNGQPAAGLGGTADVVQYARDNQKKIIHLNPLTREVTISG
jgi:hypothetical protein